MTSHRTPDHPWTVEDYQYFINRAEVYNLKHLADVLLVFFKKDFPGEVPDSVMSQRGTRPRAEGEQSAVITADFNAVEREIYKRYLPPTVPEPPLGG